MTETGRAARVLLVLPAITFLVGLALGAALVWVGAGRGDPPAASAPAAAGASAEAGDETLPPAGGAAGSCQVAADRSSELLELTRQAATAVAAFDAARLEVIVDQMEELDPQVRAAAAECRS